MPGLEGLPAGPAGSLGNCPVLPSRCVPADALAETCSAATESAACCGPSGGHVLCSVPKEGTTCEDQQFEDEELTGVDPASIFGRFITIGESMNFADATQYCATHYAGLASIHSPSEQAHAKASCDFYAGAEGAPVGCWIGFTSHGRHCHSTLSMTVIHCHSLGIYILILLPLLSFSVKMTVSPVARLHG
jgi:hypothetical protein